MAANKIFRGASFVAAVVAVLGVVAVLFLITPWILMLIAGALFPEAGISFVQAILGTIALSIIGGFFKGTK